MKKFSIFLLTIAIALMAGKAFSHSNKAPATPLDSYSNHKIVALQHFDIPLSVPEMLVDSFLISGTITEEGVGVSAVNVSFSGLSSVLTNSSGQYSRNVPTGWGGTVEPTKSGFTFYPPTHTYVSVVTDIPYQDFIATSQTFPISGNITENGLPVIGVTVSFSTIGSVETNSSGYYIQQVPYLYTGIATPAKSGYSFTPVNRSYSNVSGPFTAQNYTSTLLQFSISGTIQDAQSSPIANVEVVFGTLGSVYTNSSGQYSRAVPYGWSGTATPFKSTYSFSPPYKTYNNIIANVSGENYTGTTSQTYAISGTIVDNSSNPIEFVTINFTNGPGPVTTNSSGQYTQNVPQYYTGVATPSKSGFTFTPTSRSYTNVSAPLSAENYTGTLSQFTISGTITDLQSQPIQGVEIVFGTQGSVYTNSSGQYSKPIPYGWTGTATPFKATYTFNPPYKSYNNVTANLSGENYAGTTSQTYAISGTILDNIGNPVENVTVNFSNGPGPVTTNTAGQYTQNVPQYYSGTATPSKTGYTFNPVNRPYTNITAPLSSENYTGTLAQYTISGTIIDQQSAPIQGVEIVFGALGSVLTNSSGQYSKSVPHGWSGNATPFKATFTFNPPYKSYNNVNVNIAGENYTGTTSQTFSISGTILDNLGNPIEFVTVTFSNIGPVTTDASGYYSQNVPQYYSGNATPSKDGYSFSPQNRSYSNVISTFLSQNYTGTLSAFNISGTIVDQQNNPVSNVEIVFGSIGSAYTDTFGEYSILIPYGWSGNATPFKNNYSFTPPYITYTNVISNFSDQNYSGTTSQTYIISGTIQDDNGIPIEFVTVNFPGVGPVYTNSTGYYSQNVPQYYTGIVTPSKDGYTFTPPNRQYSNVISNQPSENYAGTLSEFTISGTIIDLESNPIDNVEILFGTLGSAFTNASGYYEMSVPYAWSGNAVPFKSNYTFTPPYIQHNNITAHTPNQNYSGTTSQTYTIAGNIIDGTGSPIEFVTVTFSGLGSVTTNSSGYYSQNVPQYYSGTMTPFKAGFSFSPENRTYSNVNSSFPNENYTGSQSQFTISGTLSDPQDNPIANVELVFGTLGSVFSNSSGQYSRAVPYGWSGNVTPYKNSYTFTPPYKQYANVTANIPNENYSGTTSQTYSISGKILDTLGHPIEFVMITFSDIPGYVTTNSTGYYMQNVPQYYSGVATPTKTGYTFEPSYRNYSNVNSHYFNENYSGVLGGFELSGYIRNGSNQPIVDVEVNFSSVGSVYTDLDGYYAQQVPYGWSGDIFPFKASFTFIPFKRTQENVTTNISNLNFTGNQGDSLKISIEPDSKTICFGEAYTIVTVTSGGFGDYHYSWQSVPVGSYDSVQNITVYPTVDTWYTVTVHDAFNTAKDSILIHVQPIPEPKDIIDQKGSTSSFTACRNQGGVIYNVIGPVLDETYSWNLPDGGNIIHGENSQQVVINWGNISGPYTLILNTIRDQCSTSKSVVVQILDDTAPSPTEIEIKETNVSCILMCMDTTADFYQWGYTVSETQQEFVIEGKTERFCEIMELCGSLSNVYWIDTWFTTNNCVSRSYYNYTYPVGLNEQTSENDFKIYPNPADDIINILMDNALTGKVDVRIYNSLGNQVCQNYFPKIPGAFKALIQLPGLKSGLYILTLNCSNQQVSKKLIINH